MYGSDPFICLSHIQIKATGMADERKSVSSFFLGRGIGGGGCWSDKFSLFWHKQNRWQFEMVCRIFEVLEGALKLFVWGTFIIGVLVYI